MIIENHKTIISDNFTMSSRAGAQLETSARFISGETGSLMLGTFFIRRDVSNERSEVIKG